MSGSRIIIDQRPLAIVLFSKAYRFIFLSLLGLAFYAFLQCDPWPGLTVEGYRTIGAFFVCLILWMTQLVPMAITGLLAVGLIPMLEIMPSKEAFSYFGSEAVFFILGSFILSAALLKTGLSTRLAVWFIQKGKNSPSKLLFRIMLSCSLLSCVMPEHAVAAFSLPIIFEMARSLKYMPFGGSYGRGLFMAMAWGCVIGGIITYLGGARAPLALAIVSEMTGENISFWRWMQTSLPLAIPLFFLGFFLIRYFFKIDVDSVEDIRMALEKRNEEMGRMTWSEKWVALILSVAVYLWIF